MTIKTLPHRVKDMTGQTFNRWTVIEYAGLNKHSVATWLCKCVCGNTGNVIGHALRTGHSKSCGCQRKDAQRSRPGNHGMRGTPTYNVWDKMIGRCHRPSDNNYPSYGQRGIIVCDKWRGSFVNFLADMGEKPHGKTLDRINNNEGYTPENCRWATHKEQSRNTRRNKLITFQGETHCIAEWAEITGISACNIKQRLAKYNWPVERALTEPVHKH